MDLSFQSHAHFLFRTGVVPLAKVMRRLLTGYAVRFNRRHRRHGQLFQNRYKSIVCQEDAYLKELVRYYLPRAQTDMRLKPSMSASVVTAATRASDLR